MNFGQTVYSSFNIIEDIYLYSNEIENYNFLKKIIERYSDVILDLNNEDFENSNNPILKSLLKRPHKITHPQKKFFDNLNSEDLSNFSRDIFLLDIDNKKRDSLSDKFGTFVLNKINLQEVSLLKRRFYKTYKKGQTIENNVYDNPWLHFINKIRLFPINSIIINDNYIFSNIDAGIQNITSLILALLPQTLSVDFHLLINTDNRNGNLTKNKLIDILNKINKNLSLNIDYKIKVGIITHNINDMFHSRVLISNYHVIKSDYGFKIFNGNKITQRHILEYQGMYYSLFNDEGDIEIETYSEILQAIKCLISRKKKIPNIELCTGYVNNRLLYDFSDKKETCEFYK